MKKLFARSGNRCAFPKCPTVLTLDDTLLGEVCHIKGERLGSARHDPNQPETERHAYDNLIIMCPTHHKVIDDDEEAYTVERLHKMKSEHEAAATQMPDHTAERFAETYFKATISNIGQMGGVAAQNFRADNFTINHHGPADPFSQQRSAQAVAIIWKAIVNLRNEFGPYVYIDSILTRKEIENSYETGWRNPLTYLNDFSSHDASQKLMDRAGAFDVDMEKPFASKEAWSAFHAIRGAYGRYGYLLSIARANRHYRSWQEDDLMSRNLRSVLSAELVDIVKGQLIGGFSAAITSLEEEFLTHAGFRPK